MIPHSTMKLALAAALSAALVLGSRLLGADAAPACGGPGKPPCPLQAWMRSRVAAPYALRDFPRLAVALEELAEDNPERASWARWSEIAKAGADAARRRDQPGALRSCTRCHALFREGYRARHRERVTAGAAGLGSAAGEGVSSAYQ